METKYRLEAPDGGWGILVCVGMALSFISPLAALSSFGLVFGDFLKSMGAETSAISLITSAFFCSYSFAGLFSGSLFNRFGLRTVGLLGGFSYFLGCILQIFVNSTITLFFAFSFLQGFGFGLMLPSCLTTFNNYFVKKRVMWMSFAQTLIGVGAMFYPVLMQKLLEWYGFRGCLIVLAGINAHVVLGMLLMQPVEWHMRKVIIKTDEDRENGIPLQLTKMVNKRLSLDNNIKLDMKTTNIMKSHEDDTSHVSPLMYNRKNSRKLQRDMFEKISSRCSSITSLGDWTGTIVVADSAKRKTNINSSRRASTQICTQESQAGGKSQRSGCQIVIDFLDLTLLQQPVYINIVLGVSFALYSDITFFTLQPLYLFELGFNKPDTANIIAIAAAADLVSRIVLAVVAVFIQVPSRYIYLAGTIFTILARFVFLNAFDLTSMSIITAVMGFLRTWIHVTVALIFAEYLPKERFASGYGLFMFLKGNIMFAISPVIGYIRDKAQDYLLTFHFLNFIMALCAFPWAIEILYTIIRRRTQFIATIKT